MSTSCVGSGVLVRVASTSCASCSDGPPLTCRSGVADTLSGPSVLPENSPLIRGWPWVGGIDMGRFTLPGGRPIRFFGFEDVNSTGFTRFEYASPFSPPVGCLVGASMRVILALSSWALRTWQVIPQEGCSFLQFWHFDLVVSVHSWV